MPRPRRKSNPRGWWSVVTGTTDPLQHIRDWYGVPAHVGRRINFDYLSATREGTIVGHNGASLLVQFDDAEREEVVHPTWHVQYLECGQCSGSGTVECWHPGGLCTTPNEPGCETCGPCNACTAGGTS